MAGKEKDKKVAPAPIIVKRIKKGGGGHHGGAWKIAYADFVTAMMAFFLLMWLLGSTSKAELQGIADFFQNPAKMAMPGGSGAGDATSIVPGGGKDLTRRDGQVKNGDVKKEDKRAQRTERMKVRAELARLEKERLEALQRKIAAAIEANPRLAEFKKQIKLEMTTDGLVIHIVDEQQRPMFDVGRAAVKDYMRDILREVGRLLNEVDHRLTITGHTDAAPYSGGDRGYSNWELSADRANASRRELVAGGIVDGKILRVVGLASVQLVKPEEPRDPSNRRITITVMNRQAEEQALGVPDETAISDAEEAAEALAGAAKAPAPATALESATTANPVPPAR
ncbi:MAG TPA: flagellar motor protein MotB [Usitatibacteraceae bacterium]|nr:flagellar motor protein MotB [Usitatibacteraceae bacterium]